MDFSSSQFWISLVQIVWIDLLLSGDNAIVIAMACRNLPPEQRRIGILLGAGAAIGLRILFAVIISYLLGIPFLKIVGGLLLFWIAIKLVEGDEEHTEIAGGTTLWAAVRTIAIADAVMSLDNVLAVSAAAHGNIWLFSFGIALSIPMIIYGSNIILGLLTRFPILVWLGAGVLGWIAGDMITNDPQWKAYFGPWTGMMAYVGDTIGALIVVASGFFIKRRKERATRAI